MSNNQEGLPWHIVEQAIIKEKQWIIQAFDFGQKKRKDDEERYSTDEMLRPREINTQNINALWISDKNWEFGYTKERHGAKWHRAMMNLVRRHFKENNFEVTTEPYLNWGRADLGVYKQGYPNLYVEIGTTSLFKV